MLIKVLQLDLADLGSVATFASNVAAELKGKKLSILVCDLARYMQDTSIMSLSWSMTTITMSVSLASSHL